MELNPAQSRDRQSRVPGAGSSWVVFPRMESPQALEVTCSVTLTVNKSFHMLGENSVVFSLFSLSLVLPEEFGCSFSTLPTSYFHTH